MESYEVELDGKTFPVSLVAHLLFVVNERKSIADFFHAAADGDDLLRISEQIWTFSPSVAA
jgi:hypothetical protein